MHEYLQMIIPYFPIFTTDAHPLFVYILDDYPILFHVKVLYGYGSKLKSNDTCLVSTIFCLGYLTLTHPVDPEPPRMSRSARIDCDGMINSASAQSDASQWQQLDGMVPAKPYHTWGWLESHPERW